MFRKNILFDFCWDVDKYKNNYDPEHWDLCRSFMVTHKTKFPEQKLVHLTEAFYQIGVYGSSYDPKTTRMVSALAIEVLEEFLDSHPGTVRHPFKKTVVATPKVVDDTPDDSSSKKDAVKAKPASIWDVAVDQSILANVLVQSQMKSMLKGFVIVYDVTRESTMNDNKVSILEESFKRSKFGPCHWDKDETHNNLCPIRMRLKWKGTVLAEGEGPEDKSLRVRLAQAVLSKLSSFSHGIEAKWIYYRDGRKPDLFDHMNPRKSNIFKSMPRSQFKAIEEITSYIDTFANSISFAEIIFGMDFSNTEKNQIMEYITKSWGTRLTYRTVNKVGVKSRCDTHLCMYHIRTGEELKRWLEKFGGENERYRLVPPGDHRRAGKCDNNVREVLTVETEVTEGTTADDLTEGNKNTIPAKEEVLLEKDKEEMEEKKKDSDGNQNKVSAAKSEQKETTKSEGTGEKKQENQSKNGEEEAERDLEKLLNGFVLFYNAKRNSEIDKDDWFSALCDSFKISKFGALEVISDNIRPLRTRCILKLKDKTLASAEGLTETQAKTAATLQLISKLEPFTYIIQAKEEYFFGGKVPPFIENPDPNKSDVYRVVRRKDLPNYYSIFQTIDDFTKKQSDGELVFGADFTWELKNEIVVYLKAKGLDYRYFTMNDQKPWSHMAIYHSIQPENLKDYLLKNGGENGKYKLIAPQKAEPISYKTIEVEAPKVPEKSTEKPHAGKAVEKRKQPLKQQPKEPTPPAEESENKIQINLKKFKKDKVEYPEDTGGDFPGLILWVGIRKNSVWQKNLFCILMDSFKLSKYGDLIVEESEENVWGRKEPFKKCVIKANRKVLAVGLGETKTEAKNSASMQVLRQLRKHCYTIQAKQSYFKEGKATPFDFNPDPAKEHIYSVAKRNKFKDRAAIIKYVDEFSKKVCDEEIIFGDDFTFDEREAILNYCRQIRLTYRLMKCQSVGRGLHTHIAIFHQKPLPVIKAALMEAGGENDMYLLIPPGGKVTHQTNETDMWPDTLEHDKIEKSITGNINTTKVCNNDQSTIHNQSNSEPSLATSSPAGSVNPINITNAVLVHNKGGNIDNFAPNIHLLDNTVPTGSKIPVKLTGANSNKSSKSELYDAEEPTHNVYPANSPCKFPPGQQPHSNQNPPQPTSFDAVVGPHLQPMDYNIGAQSFHFDTSVDPKTLQQLNYEVPMGPHPQPIDCNAPMGLYPQPQPVHYLPLYTQEMAGPTIQEMPFGPQPFFTIPPPIPMHGGLQEMPLQFGPQPTPLVQPQLQPANLPMQPGNFSVPPPVNIQQSLSISEQKPATSHVTGFSRENMSLQANSLAASKETDLRDELAKKRQAEHQCRETPDRMVFDVTLERKVIIKDDEDSDGWSRKVFVVDSENTKEKSQENTEDLQERLRQKDLAKDNTQQKMSEEKIICKISPGRNHHGESMRGRTRRESPSRGRQKTMPDRGQRLSPVRRDDRRFVPQRNRRRMSPNGRNLSAERSRSPDRMRGGRYFRSRESEFDERYSREFSREREGSYHRERRRWFSISPRKSPFSNSEENNLRRTSHSPHYREKWKNIDEKLAQNIFMYKYVRQDSTTETDPISLLRATRSLDFNIDFDFIVEQLPTDNWEVSVILMTDFDSSHPLVGQGWGDTSWQAKMRAAHQAVDTMQKACFVIEPNYHYFAEGGVPGFILRKHPMKTAVYEIIQNMDSGTPLSRYTVQIMFQVFLSSEIEDLFFLATDFSLHERVLVIEMANQMGLYWRLFGLKPPKVQAGNFMSLVSTQHVCIYKECSANSLARMLHENGGSTLKYTLVDPRETRITTDF